MCAGDANAEQAAVLAAIQSVQSLHHSAVLHFVRLLDGKWELKDREREKGCQEKKTNTRVYCVSPLVLIGTDWPDLNAHTIR